MVRNVHALAIDTDICISLNWLNSLSKFIRVCHSLSCFQSTTFTTIRFQSGFSGKSVFSGINHAGESPMYAYIFLLDTHCPFYTVFQRKTIYAFRSHNHVVQPCFHKCLIVLVCRISVCALLRSVTVGAWSLFRSNNTKITII